MYDLSNPATIKSLLSKHRFTFSKAMGQNFIVDSAVCPRMAELCGVTKDSCVIEIGPGFGVLTVQLAARAHKVAAIELDKRLLPVLADTLRGMENVSVICGDVMKIDLAEIIEKELGGMKTVLCANLPYYITSPVIMHLLESHLAVDSITVMVQKETAQRICAAPGSHDAGAISCAVSFYAEPKVLFDVPSTSFMPQPKVNSSVILLKIRKGPPVTVKDQKLMFKTIRAAFGKRRKTILNAVSSGLGITKEEVSGALAVAEIPASIRGERLTLADFARLADALKK